MNRLLLTCGALVLLAAGIVVAQTIAADSTPGGAPRHGSVSALVIPAPTAQSTEADAGQAAAAALQPPTARVDPSWSARVSAATDIPERALLAYASAQLTIDAEQPGCGIGWNTLAAIGSIESDHSRFGGAELSADGRSSPVIRGVALDGGGTARIPDTDGGALDGDSLWDRAMGPMQFIPDTWLRWGADGDGDGVADPDQIDDAALTAARYLCSYGSMSDLEGWRAAVLGYNHLDSYVDAVAATATRYGELAG